MSDMPRNMDEQIRQAMRRGDFDDLPGKGKPLDLSKNPYEDPAWSTAYRMLKENGYTLPWIETRNNIEKDFESARAALGQSWRWRSEIGRHKWGQALTDFRAEIQTLNRRIRNYNLETPSTHFQRRPISADQEIAKITASTD